jgi:predicted ferric reductase
LSVRPGLSAPGGVLLGLGTICALAGTYLCLVLLLLVARVPWLEREMGQDRLVALHRRVAPYSLVLIVAHVVCTTVAYAQAAQRGILAETWTLVAHTRWMLPATAAFVVMIVVGLMSARVIRQRMSYETWWVAHLYFYLAVALALGHQLVLGPMFAGHTYATVFWSALYVFVAGAIVLSRVVLPLWLSLRHGLRVGAVVPEGAGVVSVYIGGRSLDRLRARGGQFFQWRFMTRQWWWQAHPYSLSQSPNGRWLRITVKDLGDQSARLSHLRIGTRVLAEGPYGVFTAESRHGDSVTAFAAGVGITPIRAVLDDLPSRTAVTVVCRVPDLANTPLRGELESLVEDRGWALHYVTGSRHEQRMTTERIRQLAPAVAHSDVYVCGPDSFAADIVHAVRAIGVPKYRIHHEAFEF